MSGLDEIMSQAALRADVLRVVGNVRDDTARICADCIESLLTDKQGLEMDDNTIRACVNIVRSLGRAPTKGDERE